MHHSGVLQTNIKIYIKTTAEEQPDIPQQLLQYKF